MKKSDKSACGATAWAGAAAGVGAVDAGVGVGVGAVDAGDFVFALVVSGVVVVATVAAAAGVVATAATAAAGADVADDVAEASVSGAVEDAALVLAGAGVVAGRHRSAGAFPSPLPHGAFGSMPAIDAEHTGHFHCSDSFASIYAHARTPGALSADRRRFSKRWPRGFDATRRDATLRSSSL